MNQDTIYNPALRASFEKKLVSICKGEVKRESKIKCENKQK